MSTKTEIIKPIKEILKSRQLYYVLLVLNFIVSCVFFYLYRNQYSGDHFTYLGYADGLIKAGRYSYWYFLDDYIPDTFRNPGYPLFLYFIKSIYDSVIFIKLVQLLLYFISVILVLKYIRKFSEDNIYIKNIFLIILLPNVQFSVFASQILPEPLMVFLICLYFYIDYRLEANWKKYLLIGLLCGIIFQVRPVFLFFPFLKFALDIVFEKKMAYGKHVFVLLVYGITFIPYGLWNYKHHQKFSITSIEGGAGVLHAGFWAFKIPDYYENRIWNNKMGSEFISFVDESEIEENIGKFNKEWDIIEAECAKYLTLKDSINLNKMNDVPLFKTYSSKYTIEREKLLKEFTLKHFFEEPFFTLKTKLYTFFRVWFTGIQKDEFLKADFKGKLILFFPFVVTFSVFLIFLVLIVFALLQNKIMLSSIRTELLILLYFALIHVPFAIQARYTLPVRLQLIMLTALVIAILTKKNKASKIIS